MEEKSDMPEIKTKSRRPRKKQTYQYHKSAVSISVYDPTGTTIPVDIRKQLEDSVLETALAHKLLISIAYE